MLTANEVIFIKVETAYGVDAAPGPVDAVQVANLVGNPAESARFAERLVSSGNLGVAAPLFGGSLFSLQFDMELKGSNAVTVRPEIGVPLRACGHEQLTASGTSTRYKPRSLNHESVTVYYYQDGKLTRVHGMRGSVTFSATAGEVITASFNLIGRKRAGDSIDTPLREGAFPGLSVVPPRWVGLNNFSWGTYFPELTEFTLDPQLSVNTPANANAADGFGETRITQRNPIGTIDPSDTVVAEQPWVQDFEGQVGRAVELKVGTPGGQQITIAMPKVTYRELGPGDRDGTRTLSLGYKADQTATQDDEYTITFD